MELTLHALRQINKRKIPTNELEDALENGIVKRICLTGRKILEHNKLHVVVTKEGEVITAYYMYPKGGVKGSKQHIKGQSYKRVKKLKGDY